MPVASISTSCISRQLLLARMSTPAESRRSSVGSASAPGTPEAVNEGPIPRSSTPRFSLTCPGSPVLCCLKGPLRRAAQDDVLYSLHGKGDTFSGDLVVDSDL